MNRNQWLASPEYAVATNGSAAYLAGRTESSNFPTTAGAFDSVINVYNDAFVVKLSFFVPEVPGAPTIGSATGGDGSATVAFTAPANDGGSPILDYTATCGTQSNTGSTPSITVTGLTNGAAVTCLVVARNAIGFSLASADSNSVTPATVPDAPAVGPATPGNLSVSVAFTAPASNGGSAITGYTATCGTQSNSGTVSPITVTGLTNGTAVTCTVVATNALGNSAPSAASNSVSPAAGAGPGGPDSLNVSFTGVAGDGVHAAAVQPDRKTIIAGSFTSVLGVARNNIARLNADGTLDTGFDPRTNGLVGSLSVQADGKVILGGFFTTLQPNGAGAPTVRNRIARLNTDGTLDTGFDPSANGAVGSVALQVDGKVLLGGFFTTLQPNGAGAATVRKFVARVNADGTLDTGFDPNANNSVNTVAVQSDGRVLLGGAFTTLQPNGAGAATVRNRIARLNADGTLDTGFDPNADSSVFGVAQQADGKLVLGGVFTTLQPNGAGVATARSRVARVNADGTLDIGFDPNANGQVDSLVVQADGRVLLSGFFTTLQPNGAGAPTARSRIARVNADGTLDTAFDPNVNSAVLTVALDADGKVLLGGWFSGLQPNGAGFAARTFFARLVNDPATQSLSSPSASRIEWQRGGASPESQQATFDLSTDGGANYAPLGNGTRINGGWEMTGLSLPAGRHIRARARTTDGISTEGLVETVAVFGIPTYTDLSSLTLSSGTLAPAFTAGTLTYAAAVPFATSSVTVTPTIADASATIAVGVNGGTYASVPSGSPSVALAQNVGANIVDVRVTAQDGTTVKTYTVTVTRASEPPGELTSLNASVVGSNVRATAVQPDGKTIIAGGFTSVFGVARNNIARLNADGTLDIGFDPNANSDVYSVAVQADGKVLLGGNFTTLQPNGAGASTARNFVARVNADGTLDSAFDPKANGRVNGVVLQADGNVLLGGNFTTLQPYGATVATVRNRVARVNADGTLDSGFDPSANSSVTTMALEPNGKVLLGGSFTTLQPNGAAAATGRNYVARVNPDGTLDIGFDPKADSFVFAIAVQADEKVLLAGNFLTFQPNGAATSTSQPFVARVNADGTLDTGFGYPWPTSYVHTLAVQSDGKVLIGGAFSVLQNRPGVNVARKRVARLTANGTPDTGFDPSADSTVYGAALQADGKVLLAGTFTTLQPNGSAAPTARNRFARLFNDTATQALTATSPGRVEWLRGGTSPETHQVTFELSIDGGTTYALLGSGTRITGGWELTGLSLPTSGHLRARARTYGGYQNGSGGLVETVTPFSGLPVPEVAVAGNGTNITAGDTTPDPADHTDFGSANITGGSVVRTFTISNTGLVDLTLGSVTVVGTHAADFTVTAPPASPVAPGGSTTFQVTFDPSGVGLRSATVSFTNDDGDENPFNLSIQGVGLDPGNADLSWLTLSSGALSPSFSAGTTSYTAPAGYSDFSLTVTPTKAEPNATIEVRVNGGAYASVTSGSASGASPLNVGANAVDVRVTSQDASMVKTYTVTVTRAVAAAGDLDSLNANIVGSTVNATAVQPDGKTIIVGTFTSVLGVARNRIARLNADGTLDAGFDPNASSTVFSVTVQTDGKVLLGGAFTTLRPNGAPASTVRNRIARVNADGTLDTGFDPNASSTVYSVAMQTDGKVLLGGIFTTLQPNGAGAPTTRNRIARVNADGTLDSGFDPNAGSIVRSVVVEAGGKVLLGGLFTTLQPNGAPASTVRNRVARVNADGTIDTGFDPNADSNVQSVALQGDGKVLLGGNFTTLRPNGAGASSARNRIARVNADGTLDTGFDPNANNGVNTVALQADGKVLLGGAFTTLQPNGAAAATARNRIARVNTDGTLDTPFDPNANGTVNSVALQAGGEVLVGGVLTTLQPNGAGAPTAVSIFARLFNDSATQVLTIPTASRIEWLRGGASPEANQVTFEVSVDGGTSYVLVGSGTRMSGGWELTGLSLPTSGRIRARARTYGGYQNGSSGLVEAVTVFSLATEPAAPAIGTAMAASGSVSVAFTAPDSDGGSPILDYTATCGSQSASGASSPIVVSGLTNGTPVSCTVIATNAFGSSAASSASNTVTPGPALSINDVSVAEGNSGYKLLTFIVSRTGGTSAMSFTYATQSGSAASPGDYAAKSGTGSIAAGGLGTATVTVEIKGDLVSEADETFALKLLTAAGGSILDDTGVGTITNNDAPRLSIGPATALEGNAGTRTLTFMVTRSGVSASDANFSYALAGSPGTATGGAACAGAVGPVDYVNTTAAGTGSIPSGGSSGSATFHVTVCGDVIYEPNETVVIALTSLTAGVTVQHSVGTGTVTNDDTGNNLLLLPQALSGAEGSALTVAIVLTSPSAVPVTTDYFVYNATATFAAVGGASCSAGVDYVWPVNPDSAAPMAATGSAVPGVISAIGTVVFAPGDSAPKLLTIALCSDATTDPGEKFKVYLHKNPALPVNATYRNRLSTGNIN